MKMLRHLGKIANTGKKCVVVFMELPNDPDHALVIPTESLHDSFHQVLMSHVESQSAQQTTNLGEFLGRKLMPEGGKSILQTLHEGGKLVRVKVDNVVMVPYPNASFPLRQILSDMKKSQDQDVVVDETPSPQVDVSRMSEDEKVQIAKNLLTEADLLEATAEEKRKLAYSYAPTLKPVVVDNNDFINVSDVINEIVETGTMDDH